jgi:hypothetical protein
LRGGGEKESSGCEVEEKRRAVVVRWRSRGEGVCVGGEEKEWVCVWVEEESRGCVWIEEEKNV